MSFKASIASLLLTKIPFLEKIEEPTKSEIGVARPKAQGQEITRTLIENEKASSNMDEK